ncbi:hypothetical protein LTR37_019306 [Vermiconidia calcicola]|uniref:Uncharacterized protein n=1 Tax=Vermiconidia calcicola TaxID=1690605 RepID=A0ACC3MGC7_9PEZI|nr:hypothetical protein LTR37_019306 [Vermiconidia calcicola]
MAFWVRLPCFPLFLWLTLCIITRSAAQGGQKPLQEAAQRPNIVFILTDDQDLHMDSLSYMPFLKEHMIDRGLSFRRHYCTVALCCPSRVSMWTGKAAHNTNVTDINPPYGGYPKFVSQGFNGNYLPTWLQQAGYGTYYVGKLFNAQTVKNYNSPHAAGWTGNDFLLDPYTYRYLNATFQRNHDEPVSYEGHYATDVLAGKAHGFLDDALEALQSEGTPFFLTVAPTAPHSDVNIKRDLINGSFTEHSNVQSPPVPAERHQHLFANAVVPRTPNFNPDKPGGASWISRLPKQNQSNVDFNDHFYRSRLRSLQAVDELVHSLVTRLTDAGVLDNTYIVYSTDNGYTIGQHRRQPGKQCAFEQDINVPFIIRGPGVPEAALTDIVTSHTDIAPTFLSLTGASAPADFVLDGQPLPLTRPMLENTVPAGVEAGDSSSTSRSEHVNVEMWGIIMSEGKFGSVLYPNHTYKALRLVGSEYSFLYTVWCSGEHELYDMKVDPFQLNNLYNTDWSARAMLRRGYGEDLINYSIPLAHTVSSSNASIHEEESDTGRYDAGPTLSQLLPRLDALLLVLKSCVGRQCTHPWESLFPGGGVLNLADALNSVFDDFFDTRLEKVSFDRCEKGYIVNSEGPMWDDTYAYGMVDEVAAE